MSPALFAFLMRRPPKPGILERQARVTEALLLAFALLVFWIGAGLLLTAKSVGVSAAGSLSLNQASAAQTSDTLGVPLIFGDRIAAYRDAHHGFADVDAIGRIPIVPEPKSAAQALAAAGYSTPQAPGADSAKVKDILHLDAPTAERLQVVRAAFPKITRWDRLLRTSLISAGRVSAAADKFRVRTWPEAERLWIGYVALLSIFSLAAHLLLRRFRPGADPFLLPLTALLSFLGVLALFSLKDPIRDMPAFVAQAQGIILGGGLSLIVSLSSRLGAMPLHRYGYLYALAAVFATVLLGIVGSGPSGSRLEVVGVQPIEFIKILMIFFLAAYLAERASVLNDPLRRWGPLPSPRRADVLPLLVLYAIPLVLFALVRDLGPVLLLFGTFLLMLYLATGRGAYVILGVLALVAGAGIGYMLHFGVFYVRVDMWKSPWGNLHKGGDQTALGLWGLASGGPFGSGLGLGGTRFIPRGGSDLVFASLGEEMGLVGAGTVVLCLLVMVVRGMRIAARAATDFDRYVASGLSIILALQAAIIIGGVLGIAPLAGITLPFVSYGKSSLVVSYFSIGTLLALSSRPSTSVVPAVARTSAAATRLLPAEYRRASASLLVALAVFFVGILTTRLVWVQCVASNRIAANVVRVPDADGVVRPHLNPRLLQMGASIARGRILDRNGLVLATTEKGKRVYPMGATTAHLIGYVDPAVGGPSGLEARLDLQLRGFDSYEDMLSYWRRKDLPGFQLPTATDVRLSLDARLQQAVLDALSEGAHAIHDRSTGKPLNRGAAVVLDVATGSVLASVTLPTFDPTTLTPETLRVLNASGDHPLINRAVSGYYPPGSTFKIVTAASLLTNNKSSVTFLCKHIDENIYWHANGVTYARRRIADDETDRPHGQVGLDDAISESCNVYFAHAGLDLGPDPLRATALAFGFARPPSAYDFGANLPDIGYGQGPMLASPMEMAGVAQTIANGGVRMKPIYRLSVAPTVAATPLTPTQAARIKSAMMKVTASGTAAGKFSNLPFTVAGKTGTAQNGVGDKVAHSWFIGFAPADHPKVAFAIIVENGGYGAAVAAPIAAKILQAAHLTP